MNFGENLQNIRKKNHMSQEDLAELLGVSRQAVSKWELGEGYPEVDKLLTLSQKLNVSLDSLLGNEPAKPASENTETSGSPRTIRIVSPHEGVILNVSRVVRSQQFRGGANSPKFALFAADGNDTSPWGGVQNTFLAWYRNLEDVTEEIKAIQKALDAGEASYELQYSVKCRRSLLSTRIED